VEKVITVPENLQRACDEFNGGRYFECHETLEEVWQEEQGEVRDLYKGLIQLAAAFVHLRRANFIGAERLLRTAVGYLAPYREAGAMGFDVESVCKAAEAGRAVLLRLGPARASEFDFEGAPVITLDAGALPAEARRWAAWGFDRLGASLAMTITIAE
jgi:hypothetical protein